MLFMFYPFRNESEVGSSATGNYMEKLNDPVVRE